LHFVGYSHTENVSNTITVVDFNELCVVCGEKYDEDQFGLHIK